MESELEPTIVPSHIEAHERFKNTQSEVCDRQLAWEHAQGRFVRAALSRGLSSELTRRAHSSLVQAYDEYAMARAEHEIARHDLWEAAKVAQLERELAEEAG